MTKSFYCGDAAGRPKTATKPKDFSDGDLKFAKNIGVAFRLPEEVFLDQKEDVSVAKNGKNAITGFDVTTYK
jgi:hypothetical protein